MTKRKFHRIPQHISVYREDDLMQGAMNDLTKEDDRAAVETQHHSNAASTASEGLLLLLRYHHPKHDKAGVDDVKIPVKLPSFLPERKIK